MSSSSSKAKVFKLSELLKNLKKVSFGQLKKQKKGGFVSWVNYNDNGNLKRIFVKTPKLFAPFGASNYNPDNDPSKKNKFIIALSLKDEKENSEIGELKTLLEKLDEMVVDKTFNDRKWTKILASKAENLGKKPSRKEIQMCYRRNIKVKEDKKGEDYPPIFNLKSQVKWDNGNPTVGTKVYKSTEKVNININWDNYNTVLPKFTEMKCVFHIESVWFVSGRFNFTLKLVQAKVFPNSIKQVEDFALDSDDEEVLEVTNKMSKVNVNESESDSEEETASEDMLSNDDEE